MASLESLGTLSRWQRQDLTVLEHEPAKGLVAGKDVLRTDQYGRTVVAVPAGQEPPSYLNLTAAETAALVHPDDVPRPKVHTGSFGFNPEDAKHGRIKVKVVANVDPRRD